MRFFRRKADDEPDRCPRCNEVITDDATACDMCGFVFETVEEEEAPVPEKHRT